MCVFFIVFKHIYNISYKKNNKKNTFRTCILYKETIVFTLFIVESVYIDVVEWKTWKLIK